LNYPLAAAGRTVRCPECERSYLVPTPGENPQLAGAWTSGTPATKSQPPTKPLAADGGPTRGHMPDHAGPDDPTRDAGEQPPDFAEVAKPNPTIKGALLKNIASTADEPRLAADSPLVELPILDPPRAAVDRPAASPPKPTSRGNVEPPVVPRRPSTPPEPAEPSQSLEAGLPPRTMAHDAMRETADEARLRMRRAELRARINLIIFAVGTLVMVVFAWLVIRFSRPH
jgi:hypothetical protein